MLLARAAIVLTLGLAAACGSVAGKPADAGSAPDGAGEVDATAPPPPGPDSRQVLSGSGRMTGGGITLDLQVGGVGQGKATGGGITLHGGRVR